MRFSLLKAGTAPRYSRERIGDYDRMFLDLLALPGDQWDVHDVEHDIFPENMDAYDGFVITGSRYSAYEDIPWIKKLLELTREAHQKEKRILGICFGNQIVAEALGGEVGPNPKGWDVGLIPIKLTPDGLQTGLLRHAPQPLMALESHQDIVTRLPEGAIHLARSESTAYEMFSMGTTVLCMQGHPEMDNGVIEDLLNLRDFLPPDLVTKARQTLKDHPHREFFQDKLTRFLKEGLADQPIAQTG